MLSDYSTGHTVYYTVTEYLLGDTNNQGAAPIPTEKIKKV
jgi:hypothetical protein